MIDECTNLFYMTLTGKTPCTLTGRKRKISRNSECIATLVELEYKRFFGLIYTKRFVPKHTLYVYSDKVEGVKKEDLLAEIKNNRPWWLDPIY